MRPRTNVGEEVEEFVQDYAEENGLRMPQAWTEVIEAGVDTLSGDNDNHD